MRTPNVYAATTLKKWNADCEIDRVWVPARPMGLSGLYLIRRFKIAWNVFIGKWDAVEWYSYNWAISWGNHIVTSGNASGGGSEISTKDLHDIFKRCRFQIASFEAEWERQ